MPRSRARLYGVQPQYGNDDLVRGVAMTRVQLQLVILDTYNIIMPLHIENKSNENMIDGIDELRQRGIKQNRNKYKKQWDKVGMGGACRQDL